MLDDLDLDLDDAGEDDGKAAAPRTTECDRPAGAAGDDDCVDHGGDDNDERLSARSALFAPNDSGVSSIASDSFSSASSFDLVCDPGVLVGTAGADTSPAQLHEEEMQRLHERLSQVEHERRRLAATLRIQEDLYEADMRQLHAQLEHKESFMRSLSTEAESLRARLQPLGAPDGGLEAVLSPTALSPFAAAAAAGAAAVARSRPSSPPVFVFPDSPFGSAPLSASTPRRMETRALEGELETLYREMQDMLTAHLDAEGALRQQLAQRDKELSLLQAALADARARELEVQADLELVREKALELPRLQAANQHLQDLIDERDLQLEAARREQAMGGGAGGAADAAAQQPLAYELLLSELTALRRRLNSENQEQPPDSAASCAPAARRRSSSVLSPSLSRRRQSPSPAAAEDLPSPEAPSAAASDPRLLTLRRADEERKLAALHREVVLLDATLSARLNPHAQSLAAHAEAAREADRRSLQSLRSWMMTGVLGIVVVTRLQQAALGSPAAAAAAASQHIFARMGPGDTTLRLLEVFALGTLLHQLPWLGASLEHGLTAAVTAPFQLWALLSS